jgi:membrane-bound lytic murein transglycosylase D
MLRNTALKFSFYYILIFCFSVNVVNAQSDNSKKNFSHSKLDKILIHTLESDTLIWFFEDFKKTMLIDSSWQKLLANSSMFKAQEDAYKNDRFSEKIDFELDSEALKQSLEALNAKTPLDIGYHPDLENVIKFYLRRDKKTNENLLSLSKYYFPMFEEVFDRYDIPLELKYLAIVESALNPRAKSWVGATGLWQFMYQTGKIYDLHVNSYVDERMDPIKSTEAAAKYLRDLYNIFDDWNLALAAYNSGPGNVNKAIRRSGGQKNYWAIRSFLPRETSGYVPAFFAVMYIFENADLYNLKPSLGPTPYIATDTIHTKNLIKLEQVAQITKTDVEFIEFLNPSYKLNIIPKDTTRTYTLRLPYKDLGVYVANEEKVYDYAEQNIKNSKEKLPQYVKMGDRIRYRVRSGDYLGKIANKYGVRVSDIKRWNGLRNNNLRIGQRLTIYPKNANFSSASKTNNAKSTKKKKSNRIADSNATYTVKQGDTLWSISRKFENVTVQNLKKINNLRGNSLKPGMVLKISS